LVFAVSIMLSTTFFSKFVESNYMQQSGSLMANYRFLRNLVATAGILCCFLLPLTLNWIPSVGSGFSLNSNLTNVSNRSSGSFNVHSYDQDYLSFLPSNNESLLNTNTNSNSENDNNRNRMISLQTPCDKSNIFVVYHNFHLHILLFYIAILACSCFIQLYFYYKFIIMFVGILIYVIGLQFHRIYDCLAETMVINQQLLFTEIVVQMFFYIIFLHLIDRRVFNLMTTTCF
jgi:hypothetical protein